ncbi:uncharacterized protein LOC143886743 [Tasmannia lanceolata]|uniref:uncharacterized protein LOC143886743 n=1 Tax=Tasmannia lanceolata TaxID=3420 RepID=UPI004062F77E
MLEFEWGNLVPISLPSQEPTQDSNQTLAGNVLHQHIKYTFHKTLINSPTYSLSFSGPPVSPSPDSVISPSRRHRVPITGQKRKPFSDGSGSNRVEQGPENRVEESPKCQVEGCNSDLSQLKPYKRRHKVCEFHFKAPTVLVAGLTQRFCNLCSRFHLLSEFDQEKRSCTKRLTDHNSRRRKLKQSQSENHQTSQGTVESQSRSRKSKQSQSENHQTSQGTVESQSRTRKSKQSQSENHQTSQRTVESQSKSSLESGMRSSSHPLESH